MKILLGALIIVLALVTASCVIAPYGYDDYPYYRNYHYYPDDYYYQYPHYRYYYDRGYHGGHERYERH